MLNQGRVQNNSHSFRDQGLWISPRPTLLNFQYRLHGIWTELGHFCTKTLNIFIFWVQLSQTASIERPSAFSRVLAMQSALTIEGCFVPLLVGEIWNAIVIEKMNDCIEPSPLEVLVCVLSASYGYERNGTEWDLACLFRSKLQLVHRVIWLLVAMETST